MKTYKILNLLKDKFDPCLEGVLEAEKYTTVNEWWKGCENGYHMFWFLCLIALTEGTKKYANLVDRVLNRKMRPKMKHLNTDVTDDMDCFFWTIRSAQILSNSNWDSLTVARGCVAGYEGYTSWVYYLSPNKAARIIRKAIPRLKKKDLVELKNYLYGLR